MCDILVNLSDNEFALLKKSADDNHMVVSFLKFVVVFIFIAIVAFGPLTRYLNGLADLRIEYMQAEQNRDLAILAAKNDIYVREIEQDNLSFEQYLQLIKAQN